MPKKIVGSGVILLFLLSASITLKLQAQNGVAMGEARCAEWRGGHYVDVPCPQAGGSGNISSEVSKSDFDLQLINSAVPLIMELFKKDPKKQREMLEAQQRELEKIAIKTEEQQRIKDALHDKLMALYKQVPDAQKLESKPLTTGSTDLKPKTFDGDNGDYMYKGVDVNTPNNNLVSGNSYFGVDLSARDIQLLTEPETDPVIVDLRNANGFIAKNIQTDSIKIVSLKLFDPKGNGDPIFQKTDCIELSKKLKGYRNNFDGMQKTIQLTRNELNEWEEKNNEARNSFLIKCVSLGMSQIFENIGKDIEKRKKAAISIRDYLMDNKEGMKKFGYDAEKYKNTLQLLNSKIINYENQKIGAFVGENIYEYTAHFTEWLKFTSKNIFEMNSAGKGILNDPEFMKYSATEYEGKFTEAADIFMNNPGVDLFIKQFENISPLVMWSKFAVDQTYNATEWILSYNLILQQNQVHRNEKVAAEVMHQKINDTIESMKDCPDSK